MEMSSFGANIVLLCPLGKWKRMASLEPLHKVNQRCVNLRTSHANELLNSLHFASQRKRMTCKRCNLLMYTGPKKSKNNHKRGVCPDGCPSKMKAAVKSEGQISHDHQEALPPYPQPEGIFTHGKIFHPIRFQETLKAIYSRTVLDKEKMLETGGISMEEEAFVKMYERRSVHLPDGKVVFRLFPSLQLDPATPESAIIEFDGVRYLDIPMMRDTNVTFDSHA